MNKTDLIIFTFALFLNVILLVFAEGIFWRLSFLNSCSLIFVFLVGVIGVGLRKTRTIIFKSLWSAILGTLILASVYSTSNNIEILTQFMSLFFIFNFGQGTYIYAKYIMGIKWL